MERTARRATWNRRKYPSGSSGRKTRQKRASESSHARIVSTFCARSGTPPQRLLEDLAGDPAGQGVVVQPQRLQLLQLADASGELPFQTVGGKEQLAQLDQVAEAFWQ
jgi:hypothetical protein